MDWARQNGIALNARELVTGEHSGLKSAPQMATDNPNLAPALAATGVTVLAADASREAQQRSAGTANTVPRHPMNIFYNVATRAGEIDEYNWIYDRRADGGSGICEDNPATSTCIAPLTADGFDRYLVPLEADIALGHVVTGDPLPHYAHQSNVDAYTATSGFPLTATDQLTFNRRIAGLAHSYGLAAGLKNDLDQAAALLPSFDFAVNEERARYKECEAIAPFTAADKAVFHAEYDLPTAQFCPTTRALRLSSVRKHLQLDAWRETC